MSAMVTAEARRAPPRQSALESQRPIAMVREVRIVVSSPSELGDGVMELVRAAGRDAGLARRAVGVADAQCAGGRGAVAAVAAGALGGVRHGVPTAAEVGRGECHVEVADVLALVVQTDGAVGEA